MKPQDCIDKFIAFDNDYGALWAHIVSVTETDSGQVMLVADKTIVRHHGNVHRYQAKRAFYWDALKKDVRIVDSISESDKDSVFIEALKDEAPTALALGTKDILGIDLARKDFKEE